MSSSHAPSREPHRAELEIVVGSVIISFSAVFVELSRVGPTATGVYRNLFGTIALLALALVRRDTVWRGWRSIRWPAIGGLCFAADIYFWHRSIYYVGPGLATILGNFQVFFMAAAGVLLFHERVTARLLVSVPLAVGGLFLLVGLNWSHFDATYRRGVVFGLITAASYAAYLLCLRGSRRDRDRLPAVTNLAWATGITALLLIVAALVEGESLRIPDGRTLLVLVAYGVFCQALGWIVISRNLHKVDASRAALILLSQPTLTFAWDMLFFHRRTSWPELIGALLAIAAIYQGGIRSGRTTPRGVQA